MDRAPTPPIDADLVSKLCLACGLCCAGALFTHVTLSAEEVARLRALGVRVRKKRNGAVVLPLGCSALEGARCSVYDGRPAGCRAFVCEVGRALEGRALTLEAALAEVREAQRLIEAVAAELPAGVEHQGASPLQVAQRHGLVNGPGPLRAAQAYLRGHFLEPRAAP